MPIKQLTVSFKISADTFARMLAAGHEEMSINVYDEPSRVTHPRLTNGVGGVRALILGALKADTQTIPQLKTILVDSGFSAKSLNSQLHSMLTEKLVKRVKVGLYAITEKGRAL